MMSTRMEAGVKKTYCAAEARAQSTHVLRCVWHCTASSGVTRVWQGLTQDHDAYFTRIARPTRVSNSLEAR